MTHLASADEDPRGVASGSSTASTPSLADLDRQGVQPQWVHAANSAGLLHLRPTHTLVRPGLLLYGLEPAPALARRSTCGRS